MDPVQVLRERERLLAIRYGADHAPNPLDGEDLGSLDVGDALHWVQVYGELVGFLRGVSELDPKAPARDPTDGLHYLESRRAMRLELKIHELHLAFWTDRLQRLRVESDSTES